MSFKPYTGKAETESRKKRKNYEMFTSTDSQNLTCSFYKNVLKECIQMQITDITASTITPS
jgi:hypothetical protein